MKKSRFTEEQIVFALKQAELGASVPEGTSLPYRISSLASNCNSSVRKCRSASPRRVTG
ncbi:hypothetical protein L2X67_13235 [Enterobacter ludwigii]|nr:hypothetical protein [Enterobacter ludwigii]